MSKPPPTGKAKGRSRCSRPRRRSRLGRPRRFVCPLNRHPVGRPVGVLHQRAGQYRAAQHHPEADGQLRRERGLPPPRRHHGPGGARGRRPRGAAAGGRGDEDLRQLHLLRGAAAVLQCAAHHRREFDAARGCDSSGRVTTAPRCGDATTTGVRAASRLRRAAAGRGDLLPADPWRGRQWPGWSESRRLTVADRVPAGRAASTGSRDERGRCLGRSTVDAAADGTRGRLSAGLRSGSRRAQRQTSRLFDGNRCRRQRRAGRRRHLRYLRP